MNARWIDSPVGALTVHEAEGAVTRLEWGRAEAGDLTPTLQLAIDELNAYFAGDLEAFTVPLAPEGGAFQQAFLKHLSAIPFGETKTYGDLAKALDVPPQAIGQACGANPIPVIIPCHRVLGADGLGGFSGGTGIETKVALLKHEGAASLLL